MEQNIAKFFKPIALAAICFVSLIYLTKSVPIAVAVSLVPLLLGWLGIMQSFAYGVATIIFLAAVAWAATPSDIKNIIKTHSDRAMAEVSAEVKSKQ
ncbi:hypothetical protein [Methylobacterium sp. 10]|uniref:hypothetical protein n=1 Tax=Methylobacterium sp. 10 TaxID=1101191 RepID=UPI0009DF050F|nr:hypothetical protein [Methylobacterium sp. 10]